MTSRRPAKDTLKTQINMKPSGVGCQDMGGNDDGNLDAKGINNGELEDEEDKDHESIVEEDPEVEEPQESQQLRAGRSPVKPSDAEVEEHRLTHHVYRSWCRQCVEGRGYGEKRAGSSGESNIPVIGIDYWYITAGSIFRREEMEYALDEAGEQRLAEGRRAGAIVKCLIVRDFKTKCVFGHVIPFRDQEQLYSADLVTSDVAWLGHVKIMLKSDGEPAIRKLAQKALENIKCMVDDVQQVAVENSHPYDSKSNGGTEIGIKIIRGLLRTLTLCLESRLGQKIPPQHPLTSWLLEHASHVHNAMTIGHDGMTPWHRARGRPFNMKLYGFGEAVHWKPPAKGPQRDELGNMGPRLLPGTFLGYHRISNSYRVVDASGNVRKTRALMRKPYDERWNVENLQGITVVPWSTRTQERARAVPLGDDVEKDKPETSEEIPLPRRLKITMQVLERYGTTDDCPQCRHVRDFRETKPGIAHTERCRERIVEAMRQDDAGRQRLEDVEQRQNRGIAARIQQHDVSAEEGNVQKDGDDDDAPQIRAEQEFTNVPSHPGAIPEMSRVPFPNVPDHVDEDATPRGSGKHLGDDDGANEESMDVDVVEEKPHFGGDDLNGSDVELEVMLMSLGAGPKNFRRERKTAYNRMVSEIYSPPRVTEMVEAMPELKLIPGMAWDITGVDPDDGKPWDFNDKSKREKVLKMIRRDKPMLLIGSPMCTAWSTWQRLNDLRRSPQESQRLRVQARLHLDFVCMLYREQVEAGRFFLHEHPQYADSWNEHSIIDVMKLPGVNKVVADECQYGQEVLNGKHKGRPVRKPTGFMSNSSRVLERLMLRCQGRGGECSRERGGRHATASGKIARDAARYPPELCKAILRGFVDELQDLGMLTQQCYGLQAAIDEESVGPAISIGDKRFSGKYKDDLTKQVLRDDLVEAARALELTYFEQKGVWRKRLISEIRRLGKVPISVRWVDVNKGDDANPRYRSRLVARQLKATDTSGGTFFAPTPPLEALRTILSFSSSSMRSWRPSYDPKSKRRMQLSFIDVARAYFNAKTDPENPTFVSLPLEHPDSQTHAGELLRHMYGTRLAADGWQEEYSSFLVSKLHFVQGVSTPCVFRHPDKQIVVSVHGDDFTAAGAAEDLDWYESQISKAYEITIQPRLGPGDEDAKEAVVLNRIIRWTSTGVEYEADPRQAEKLLIETGLDENVNSVATPGVRLSFDEIEKDEPLEQKFHTSFRAAAARANYLAADRPDCQYAAKEICRWMSSPCRSAWNALKRLCRYIAGLPRLVYRYERQDVRYIDIYTDTDWAGCAKTRKSTSGGCVLLNGHSIKTWSSTQSSVTLSSGEAEFAGVVRGAGVGLGYASLLRDLGLDIPIRLWTDSTAAIGICSRQGLGKLRHLDTHTLWVQQAVRAKRFEIRKVLGDKNPADLMTKHSISRDKQSQLIKLQNCYFVGGRAASAAQVRAGAGRTGPNLAEINSVEQPGIPMMPHRTYDKEQLDRLHPALVVPDGVIQDEDEEDGAEEMLRLSKPVVQDIVERARHDGRLRREVQ